MAREFRKKTLRGCIEERKEFLVPGILNKKREEISGLEHKIWNLSNFYLNPCLSLAGYVIL